MLASIPFKTPGVNRPEPGAFWRANIGRIHDLGGDRREISVWSAAPGAKRLDDRNGFGEWVLEKTETK